MFANILTGEKSFPSLNPIWDYLITELEDPEVISNLFL